jgi:hypothetical protein
MVPEILGPKLLGVIGQVQPLTPTHQIKSSVMVKGRERKFILQFKHRRRGKVAFQPILPRQPFALGLNRRKN